MQARGWGGDGHHGKAHLEAGHAGEDRSYNVGMGNMSHEVMHMLDWGRGI